MSKYDITQDPNYIEIQLEAERYKNQVQQLLAEFSNYKKRVNNEIENLKKYCLADFLIKSIDNFDILDTAANTEVTEENIKKYADGIKMINNKFYSLLADFGVTKMDCMNKQFDPDYMEAVDTIIIDGMADNTVRDIYADGYMYHDKVLLPAKVVVSQTYKTSLERPNHE